MDAGYLQLAMIISYRMAQISSPVQEINLRMKASQRFLMLSGIVAVEVKYGVPQTLIVSLAGATW